MSRDVANATAAIFVDSALWLALYWVPRYNVFTFRAIEANKMYYFPTLF
jgi:hypothetical protein